MLFMSMKGQTDSEKVINVVYTYIYPGLVHVFSFHKLSSRVYTHAEDIAVILMCEYDINDSLDELIIVLHFRNLSFQFLICRSNCSDPIPRADLWSEEKCV